VVDATEHGQQSRHREAVATDQADLHVTSGR
jgi:hypothetical protein